jgi:mercuric ion binding protein
MKSIWALAASLFLLTGASLASECDETVTFDVEKMTCATCPITVRKAMQRVEGVIEVEVSMEDESAVVTYDPSATTAAEIGRASTDVGFPAKARSSE